MADVTIDAGIRAKHYTRGTGALKFCTGSSVQYQILLSPNNVVGYRKSTDDGVTWGSFVPILDTGETTNGFRVYGACFDQETAGDSGTKIHVVGRDKQNGRHRYRSLDTASDTLGTETTVSTTATADDTHDDYNAVGTVQVIKTRGGNLAFFYHGSTHDHRKSTDGGATWSSALNMGFDFNSSDDQVFLVPANDTDANDYAAFVQNDGFGGGTADSIKFFLYDDSANTWDAGTTVGSTVSGDWSDDIWCMYVVIRHSDGKAICAWWNDTNTATADFKCSECVLTSAGKTSSAKTDVVSNTTAAGEPGLFIDQATGDIYAIYLRGGTWHSSVDVYYKKSTDGGSTWGTETKLNTTAHDTRRVYSGNSIKSGQTGRFMPSWVDDGSNDLLTNNGTSVSIGSASDTGTLAVTADTATVALPGTSTVTGTLAITPASATVAMAGTTNVAGTMAITATSATLAMNGSGESTGTLGVTADTGTLEMVGTSTDSGGLGITADTGVLAMAGTSTDAGSLTITAAAPVVAMAGTTIVAGDLIIVAASGQVLMLEGAVTTHFSSFRWYPLNILGVLIWYPEWRPYA